MDAGVLSQITEHYDQDIYKIMFEDGKVTSPLFALCEAKMEEEHFGRQFIARVQTDPGAAISADASIADAIAGDGNLGGRPTRDRWAISRVTMDAPFKFERDEVIAMSKMGADKQFDVITDEMDSAVHRMRNKFCYQVAKNGWGTLAVTTAQTSSTFTVDPAFVNLFPLGKRLVASVSESTDVLLNSAAQLWVTGTNPDTGVITLSGNPVTTWANNAVLYIFDAGDRIATDPSDLDAGKTSLTGLAGWVDPSFTGVFKGITRTGNPALCGFGVDCSTLDTGSGLIRLVNRLFQFGRKSDLVLVNPTSWELLQRNYDAQKNVALQLGEYKIAFEGYKLATMFGSVPVVPDPFLKPGEAFAGPFMDKKLGPKLYHATSKLIELDNFDGKEFERITTSGARSFKGQFFFSGNMVIGGPGMYGKATGLPTS